MLITHAYATTRIVGRVGRRLLRVLIGQRAMVSKAATSVGSGPGTACSDRGTRHMRVQRDE